MKKTIILIIILIFGLCGCTKEETNRYDNFKHYKLIFDKEPIQYEYIDDKGIKSTYVISDITPENSELIISGLFYQVEDDDYILLDEIESYISKTDAYFNDNKLYLTACNGLCQFEYTLKEEDINKKELKFDTSKISDKLTINSINKIEDKYIYYNCYDYRKDEIGEDRKIEIKCSLDSYKCILNNK